MATERPCGPSGCRRERGSGRGSPPSSAKAYAVPGASGSSPRHQPPVSRRIGTRSSPSTRSTESLANGAQTETSVMSGLPCGCSSSAHEEGDGARGENGGAGDLATDVDPAGEPVLPVAFGQQHRVAGLPPTGALEPGRRAGGHRGDAVGSQEA